MFKGCCTPLSMDEVKQVRKVIELVNWHQGPDCVDSEEESNKLLEKFFKDNKAGIPINCRYVLHFASHFA